MLERPVTIGRQAAAEKLLAVAAPRRSWGAAAALCLLLCATPALAQSQPLQPSAAPSGALGMADAVRAAAQWHPSVRNAAQQLLQAGAGIDVAKAGYMPQVRAGIGSQASNADIPSYASRRVHTATLSVSQMLYDFGKVSSSVDEAQAAQRASQAQVQVSVDEVALDTAQAWVEVYRQQALARIARDQLEGVRALTALVVERERKGASTRSDVAQAQARVESAQAQVLGAEAQASRARLNLMHLTGRVSPDGIAGEPPAWLGQACRAGADAVPGSPAVRLAQARREEAQAVAVGARARRLPTLSLDGSVGQGLDARSRIPGDPRTITTVGINITAPLYEGGAGSARERAAAYAVDAAEAAAEQARLTARQGFADAQAQVLGDAQRDPVLAAQVDSIHATRDLYRQQYLQLGTRSLLDLLNAEQEYHTARIQQAESLHEQYRLEVACLYHTDRLRSAFGLDEGQQAAAEGGTR